MNIGKHLNKIVRSYFDIPYLRYLVSGVFRISYILPRKDKLEALWLYNQDLPVSFSGRTKKRNVLIRWYCTSWCNYACYYCSDKVHTRVRDVHCFDIFPAEQWVRAFDRHFGNNNLQLSLVITGGEPMLDVENTKLFLNKICDREYLLNIRIDTNASWESIKYKGLKNKNKIWLNCSFHPTHVDLDTFSKKVLDYLSCGFNVGMVNFVLTNESIEIFKSAVSLFNKKKIPVSPNPRLDCKYGYTEEGVRLLKKYLPAGDFKYKFDSAKTAFKLCLFPAVAYCMAQNGDIFVGCHPWKSGNFVIDKKLPPLFDTYTGCPQDHCQCLDMYSFLKGFGRNFELNPLLSYTKKLRKLQKI